MQCLCLPPSFTKSLTVSKERYTITEAQKARHNRNGNKVNVCVSCQTRGSRWVRFQGVYGFYLKTSGSLTGITQAWGHRFICNSYSRTAVWQTYKAQKLGLASHSTFFCVFIVCDGQGFAKSRLPLGRITVIFLLGFRSELDGTDEWGLTSPAHQIKTSVCRLTGQGLFPTCHFISSTSTCN